MLNIMELITFFIDECAQEFQVYDQNNGEVIFQGYFDDLPLDLWYAEVSSIDNLEKGTDILIININ